MTTNNQKFMKAFGGFSMDAKPKVRRRIQKRGAAYLAGIRAHHAANLARAQKRIEFREESARKLQAQHAKQ